MQIIFQLKPVDYERARLHEDEKGKFFDLCKECFVAEALRRTVQEQQLPIYEVIVGWPQAIITMEGMHYFATMDDNLLRQIEIFDGEPHLRDDECWLSDIEREQRREELKILKPTFGTHILEFTR